MALRGFGKGKEVQEKKEQMMKEIKKGSSNKPKNNNHNHNHNHKQNNKSKTWDRTCYRKLENLKLEFQLKSSVSY
ncbi:hypothetical protein V2J09_007903 [Rumex salicifolius]